MTNREWNPGELLELSGILSSFLIYAYAKPPRVFESIS